MQKRARLIVNPFARRVPSADRLAVCPAWLRLHGWQVDELRTDYAGHATTLAREAVADGVDVVIAVGGDGTVNEVANGLAGTATALAVLPAGTANVWAREIRMPRHPGDVAAVVERGERRTIDLGTVNGRSFILMTSLGIDADVVRDMDAAAKSRYGRLAYASRGVRLALRYPGVAAQIRADGRVWRGRLALLLLGNTRSYGGLVSLSHRATADDGLLDLVLYRAGGPVYTTMLAARTVIRRHDTTPGVTYLRAREVVVETEAPVPVQADGDLIGQTPVTVGVTPHNLRVVVPPGLQSQLFGG